MIINFTSCSSSPRMQCLAMGLAAVLIAPAAAVAAGPGDGPVSAEEAAQPPPAAPGVESPSAPPPPATASPSPPPVGPTIEMPPPASPEVERGAPTGPAPVEAGASFALPRETPIETPLGRGPILAGTAIGGYGELTFVKPSNGDAVIDMRRLVVYVGHNFTDKLRFYSEIEIEHAISSADDKGEVEVEQAYLDGLLGRHLNLRGGVIIMPVGIVNVYHEPPTFNGVDRPDVDTVVIPSTWREAGIGVFGELTEGLRYQLYLVSGFQASGFSAAEGLRDGHQEAQLARARDFGGVARLDYEPVLGTNIGLSGYFASSGRTLEDRGVGSVPVGMVEADVRAAVKGFTLRAEVALAFIGDTTALNQLLTSNDEQAAAAPVSSQLRGGYVEVGYDILPLVDPATTHGLTPFARYDYVDTQARVLSGFQQRTDLPRHSLTAGLVYRPIPAVALKADYRRRMPAEGDAFDVWSSAITWMF